MTYTVDLEEQKIDRTLQQNRSALINVRNDTNLALKNEEALERSDFYQLVYWYNVNYEGFYFLKDIGHEFELDAEEFEKYMRFFYDFTEGRLDSTVIDKDLVSKINLNVNNLIKEYTKAIDIRNSQILKHFNIEHEQK